MQLDTYWTLVNGWIIGSAIWALSVKFVILTWMTSITVCLGVMQKIYGVHSFDRSKLYNLSTFLWMIGSTLTIRYWGPLFKKLNDPFYFLMHYEILRRKKKLSFLKINFELLMGSSYFCFMQNFTKIFFNRLRSIIHLSLLRLVDFLPSRAELKSRVKYKRAT